MFFFKKFQILLLLSVLFFTPASGLNAKTIRYLGSPILNPFIRGAAKVYKDASFEIITKPDADELFTMNILKSTDILGVADNINPKLILSGAKKYFIGKDIIGIWINKANPIFNLSFHQLQEIYTGRITRWNELGSYDQPIHIYIVQPGSSIRKAFKKIILEDFDYYESNLKIVKPASSVLKKIGSDPGGIGFLSFSAAVGHKSQSAVRTILVNGQKASNQNFNYPVTRPLYLVTLADPWGKEKKFIDWVLSGQGQKIVEKFFIGHSLRPVDSFE